MSDARTPHGFLRIVLLLDSSTAAGQQYRTPYKKQENWSRQHFLFEKGYVLHLMTPDFIVFLYEDFSLPFLLLIFLLVTRYLVSVSILLYL